MNRSPGWIFTPCWRTWVFLSPGKWGYANRIVNGRAVCDSHHINEDVLYATYHAAVKAMIEDAGALLEVIQTETEVEMQPLNKAAMDEVEQ